MSMPRSLNPKRQSFPFLQKSAFFPHCQSPWTLQGGAGVGFVNFPPHFFLPHFSLLLLLSPDSMLMLFTTTPLGSLVPTSTAGQAVQILSGDSPLSFLCQELIPFCILFFFFCNFKIVIGKYIMHREKGKDIYGQLSKIKAHESIIQVKKQKMTNTLKSPYMPLKWILLPPPRNNH